MTNQPFLPVTLRTLLYLAPGTKKVSRLSGADSRKFFLSRSWFSEPCSPLLLFLPSWAGGQQPPWRRRSTRGRRREEKQDGAQLPLSLLKNSRGRTLSHGDGLWEGRSTAGLNPKALVQGFLQVTG